MVQNSRLHREPDKFEPLRFQSAFDPTDSTAYRTEIRTWQITSILTQREVLHSIQLLEMSEKVLTPRISPADREYISLKAMYTPITRTITVCQVTDYSTKDNLLFPNSSELKRRPLPNLFSFPQLFQSLTSTTWCLYTKEARIKMEESQKLEESHCKWASKSLSCICGHILSG